MANVRYGMPLLGMSIVCSLLIRAGVSAYPSPLPVCTTKCGQGEYCFGDDCNTCPDGTFRNEEYHSYPHCKMWTDKQPQEHWIIKKDGTTTTDREWVCDSGYEENQYSATSIDCVPITQSPPTVVVTTESAPTTTPPPPSSPKITTRTDSTQETTASLHGGAIAGIVFAVVSFLIIVIILICKQKPCFSRHNPVSQNENGMAPSKSYSTTTTSSIKDHEEDGNLLSRDDAARL